MGGGKPDNDGSAVGLCFRLNVEAALAGWGADHLLVVEGERQENGARRRKLEGPIFSTCVSESGGLHLQGCLGYAVSSGLGSQGGITEILVLYP